MLTKQGINCTNILMKKHIQNNSDVSIIDPRLTEWKAYVWRSELNKCSIAILYNWITSCNSVKSNYTTTLKLTARQMHGGEFSTRASRRMTGDSKSPSHENFDWLINWTLHGCHDIITCKSWRHLKYRHNNINHVKNRIEVKDRNRISKCEY